MKSTIKKWGNSPAIRIPAAVMKAVELDLDEIVDVREEEGRIIIEPVRQKAYDLHALLKGRKRSIISVQRVAALSTSARLSALHRLPTNQFTMQPNRPWTG
jgi:antitoxin MazE